MGLQSMGLARRIIPTILCKGSHLIKGKQFSADRVIGNALQAARIHAMRGVDELCILDVTATKEGREPNYDMIRKLSEKCFSPITVGGGVRTSEHVRELLKAGADKVCMQSIYYDDPELVKKISDKYGRSTIVLSIDYPLKVSKFIHRYAKLMENDGAGEILLQCIERDGTMEGYDLETIEEVSKAVSIPVVASGGCKDYEDAYNAIQAGASGVAVGALFQYADATPKGMAEYLHSRGVEVRLDAA